MSSFYHRTTRLALACLTVLVFASSAAQAQVSRNSMIGQMLMMGFPGSSAQGAWPRRLAAQIRRGQVGGVVMLGYNFKSRQGVTGLTGLFRQAAGARKLFLALDMEGGAVQRLGRKLGYPAVPSARSIARTQTPQQAARTYGKLARISRDAGFNMNLGPVVDLLITPNNPVIGRWNRSYGADPTKVTAYARAFVTAHRALGIVTVLKHFPGHGSSRTDSHDGFVDITRTWQQKELTPFARLIASGHATAIMPGHLIHQKIAGGSVPVSISRRAITGLLRGRLKFRGLVISDDLQMSAIAKNFSYQAAVIRAVNAGVDMLMISNSRKPDQDLPARTIAIISKAIDQGRISPATVKAAYRRIMRAKASLR
jgi:beta-N-acetylhexosaminidase